MENSRELQISRLHRMCKQRMLITLLSSLAFALPSLAEDGVDEGIESPLRAFEGVPDLREDESELTVQQRDFVIVPIPISNPTLGTGLVLAGSYFYAQTEQQKEVQPPSVTSAAGLYTDNDSYTFGLGHQAYWAENKWRLGIVLAHADLRFQLEPRLPDRFARFDWNIKGEIGQLKVARKVRGNWYLGGLFRGINADQEFAATVPIPLGLQDASTREIGLGLYAEYDKRDKPMNTYTGNFFKADILFNSEKLGGDRTYQSFSANYRSYHSLSPSLVLAWELKGCTRSGQAPLWDACRVPLRGFDANRYLGERSAAGQAELRWRFFGKFGAVAFAGAGGYENLTSELIDKDLITSYGVGVRYMVLQSQRINLRIDYARSGSSDAVYLSVGEAF